MPLIYNERHGKKDHWFDPAFYTIGGASFGLQAGGQSSEVVLLIMTDRGVGSVIASSFKLGADLGIAAGPVGAGVAASTATLSADALTFARSRVCTAASRWRGLLLQRVEV